MKIAVIVGSIRKDSYNKMVGNYIKEKYKDQAEFDFIDISSLPFFNEDIENEEIESVDNARKIIKESDGIMIITPEYNSQIPGVLKNALDWFSRKDYCMMKKRYISIGASIGMYGTSRAQVVLNQLLDTGAYQMERIPNSNITLSNITKKVNDNGEIIDEKIKKDIDSGVQKFIDWIK